ncbi:MAG TPA: tripartite tricarboxylate transporter substrate binding protein, partial [Burkholderiales bacterium]|nr:tripartite tricarboxylate transporter substrate binding protein [Burkholderiales bacterium]
MKPHYALAIALVAGASCGTSQAADSGYPARPIRLISPFTPGGGNDLVSRTVALAMSRNVGQSIVVDNRPGANTIVGMELVAKAAPDGYTLIMTSSTQAINATLYPKLPYDSIKSFAPVTIVGSSPLIIAVPPSSPIKSVTDLIAAARAKPGELTYPSAGTGNATHLGGELFASMAGVTLTHVPYKGSGPGLTDLSAGRLAVAFSTALSVVPFVKGGRLRAIAVTSNARSAFMPDLPTVAESGLPGYEAGSWYGVVAPARTPQPIVARLHAEIIKVLALPDVRERLVSQGIDPVGNTPDQFAAYIRAEIVKWAKIIKSTGVT